MSDELNKTGNRVLRATLNIGSCKTTEITDEGNSNQRGRRARQITQSAASKNKYSIEQDKCQTVTSMDIGR